MAAEWPRPEDYGGAASIHQPQDGNGPRTAADAYYAAFTLPNVLNYLVAGGYALAQQNYVLFVKAIGKPTVRNRMSGPVAYTPHC